MRAEIGDAVPKELDNSVTIVCENEEHVNCHTCGDCVFCCGENFHFCCCGLCGWDCAHGHPAYAPVCHADLAINHFAEFIKPFPVRTSC